MRSASFHARDRRSRLQDLEVMAAKADLLIEFFFSTRSEDDRDSARQTATTEAMTIRPPTSIAGDNFSCRKNHPSITATTGFTKVYVETCAVGTLLSNQ